MFVVVSFMVISVKPLTLDSKSPPTHETILSGVDIWTL